MVTPSDAIAPGSIPYGEREGFAAAVDAGGGEDGPSVPAATSGAAGLGGPLDPLQQMMTGGVPPSDDPITSGLSVGPGMTPAPAVGQTTPVQDRLIYVALHAKSPTLRMQARNALRILARKQKIGQS